MSLFNFIVNNIIYIGVSSSRRPRGINFIRADTLVINTKALYFYNKSVVTLSFLIYLL